MRNQVSPYSVWCTILLLGGVSSTCSTLDYPLAASYPHLGRLSASITARSATARVLRSSLMHPPNPNALTRDPTKVRPKNLLGQSSRYECYSVRPVCITATAATSLQPPAKSQHKHMPAAPCKRFIDHHTHSPALKHKRHLIQVYHL